MELSTTVNDNNHRNWVDKDIEGSVFKDKRLQQRFRKLLEQIWNGVGQTIPFACQDWANTKAAYRFLLNDRVSEKEILDGHFNATKERITKLDKGVILVLQDTTEFSYPKLVRNRPKFYNFVENRTTNPLKQAVLI